MTYGVDNEKSFEGVERWVKEVVNKVGEGVVKILVANKVDLEDVRERDRDREKEEEKENDPNMEMKEKGDKGRRRIMREQGEALAKKYGIGYCEVSAKRNRNVNELFDGLARQILSKILAEGCTISEQ